MRNQVLPTPRDVHILHATQYNRKTPQKQDRPRSGGGPPLSPEPRSSDRGLCTGEAWISVLGSCTLVVGESPQVQ
jgi:hypothetical protein